MLGRLRVGTGMYGADTVSVVADDLTTVDGHLAVALSDIVERARAAGQGFTEVSAEDVLERAQAVQSATDLWDGTIVAEGAEFRVAHNGSLEPLAVPKTQHVELRHLLRLRDGARALLEAEAATPRTPRNSGSSGRHSAATTRLTSPSTAR